MDAACREMRGIFARAATDIENSLASMEKRVDLVPHQIALGAADRGVGPKRVVSRGNTVEW
jgi:hypothetical protein